MINHADSSVHPWNGVGVRGGEITLSDRAHPQIIDQILLKYIHFTVIEQIEDRLQTSIGHPAKSLTQSGHALRLNTLICRALLITARIEESDGAVS